MHQCLLIDEIARVIVANVHDYYNAVYDPLVSMARLARTCRAFYEPATDALWSELESLKPLVRCLPSDAVHEHSGDFSHALVRFFFAFIAQQYRG